MAIYFIRHGETDANVANIFAGQKLDSPLTQKGLEQAQQAAERLKDFGITKIISSDRQRTRKTAHEIAAALGVENVDIDNRLVEYDDGVLTGTTLYAVKSLDLIAAKGAEDPFNFQDRLVAFLKEYKDSPETILLVSHGGVAKMLEQTRLGQDPRLFFDLPGTANAEIKQLDLSWL